MANFYKHGVYETLAQKDGFVWCPCMAHVRRKFVEAEGGDPVFRRNVLRRLRYLFMLERALEAHAQSACGYVRRSSRRCWNV